MQVSLSSAIDWDLCKLQQKCSDPLCGPGRNGLIESSFLWHCLTSLHKFCSASAAVHCDRSLNFVWKFLCFVVDIFKSGQKNNIASLLLVRMLMQFNLVCCQTHTCTARKLDGEK